MGDLKKVRAHPPEYYEIHKTKHRSIGRGRLKPDPQILNQIINEAGATTESAMYVGDSLYKDVGMAKEARVFGVWAEYGEARGQPGYDFLREVSHWTQEDVEKDRVLKMKDVLADATLKVGIAELLPIIKQMETTGYVRVRPKTSSWITKLSQHEADGGEFQEREGIAVEIFPVLCKAATTVEPRNRAFYDPALG